MGLSEKLRTIRGRLYLGFALLLAMILLLAGVVTYDSYRISSVNLERQTQASELHQRVDEMEIDLLNMETGKRGYLLDGEEASLMPYEAGREQFEVDLRAARELNAAARDDIVDPTALDSLEEQYRTLRDLFERQIETRRAGETSPQALRLAESESEMDRARDIIARLQEQAHASEQAAGQSTRSALGRETVLALVLGTLALLTVLGGMLYVRRGVVAPLQRLREGVRKVGEGQLNHRIEFDSADELGALGWAFNDMLDKRREATTALQEGEERFRALSEATFEGIAILDEGKIIETNRAFAEMFGFARPDVVGMDALDFVAPESREAARRRLSSSSAEPNEVVGRKRDGTRFDVEIRVKSSSYRDRLVRVAALRDVTERKKGEERIREAETRYRTVVEQIPAITYVQEVEHDRASTFVSPQVEDVLGYTPEEYISEPDLWVEILYPEDRGRVLAEDDRTDRTGEPFKVEYRMFAKDGSVVWVRDEAVLVRDEDGNPLFWQGVMLDVSEEMEALRKLRESEIRYRSLVEQIPLIVYTHQAREPWLTTYISPQVEDMLGYTPEEVLADPEHWPKTVHPEDWERVLEEDERTNRTGESFVAEYRQFAKDGSVVWVRDEAVLMHDEDGNPLFWQGVKVNITEEREAQEAVKENEKRFKQLFDQSVDALFVHDASGRIVDCNAEACRSLGYDREELLSLRIQDLATDLVSDDARASTEPTLWQRAFSGEPGEVAGIHRGEHRRKDGSTFPVEVYVGSVDYVGRRLIFASVRDVTERQKAEEALRESEERYRLVSQATNEVIWDHDFSTNRQLWSGAVEEIFGYSPQEVGGDSGWWEERIHPDDRERVTSSAETFLEGSGETWSAEYRFRRADGGYSTIVDRAYVLRDASGESTRMIGSMMDVTQRREAEERLRASEAELRALFAAMKDVILVLDADGRYLRIAPTNPSLLYKTPDELVGKTLHEVMPAEQADAFLQHIRRALETRVPINTEYTLRIGEQDVWFSGTVSPLQEDQILYVARDITERKRAEEELREAEERFRSAFDDAAVGMSLNDLHGHFTQVNRSLCEMLGYSESELLSKSFEDITHPEDVEANLRLMRALLDGEMESYQIEKRCLHAAGHLVWTSLNASAVRDREGRPLYIIAQMQDVTERKEAEARLRKSQASLAEAQRMANIGNWEFDLITGEVIWSDEVFRIYGYSPQEFVPSFEGLLENVVHPDDRSLLRENLDAAVNGGEPYDFEHRILLPDGAERIVHRRARVVRDEGGRPLRMIGTVQDVTERKRAEQEIRELNESLERRVEERTSQLRDTLTELRESEERYALVVEGSNDGIFDWNLVQEKVFWNDRLYEMVGLSSSSFTPTLDGFFELVHPDDKESFSERLTAHLERDEEFDVEFRMRHASGEHRTCIGRGKAQRDESGRPFRMAGTVTDITDRKRAEDALRLLAEASAQLSSSLDYRETLASVARLAVPELADWCAVDVLEDDGSLDRLAVAHKDPEKVELAREIERRYPADPDSPIGVYSVLRTGRPGFYPEIDDQMVEVVARDEEHLRLIREVGFTSVIIVPITARGRTLGTITLVSAESGRHYGEADLRLAEDLARRSASAVDNARLFEEAQRELAERKRAEEEIRKLNESLERRVEERTAQLRNAIVELERAGENLRRAKEEAEAANRAKSEFLANMSHEIRTPMNGVIGMTDLLLDTSLSEEQREYASTIRASGEDLLTIINDILDFSKIEAGEMRLEVIDFDLRMAVEDTVALFAEHAHEKGLELASLVDYDVPTALRGDPGRIRQILTNLVGNAVKFTEEGEVVLHAELVEEDPEEATVRISVRDTGIGMTGEQQSHVFESFSQADASTTRRYGGTGLGLAISKQIVELMGGEIGVESEAGVGSTFYFTLPLAKQRGGGRNVRGPVTDLRGIRVLVVDDNATNREILHRQLSSWGMESSEAGDGVAALEELQSAARAGAPYDLAILDMQMPGMDGMRLARRTSEDGGLSSTRLVLLTSVGQRGDGDEARRAGIEAYLTKPVRQSELYDAIATVMSVPAGPARPGEILETPLVTRHTLRERQTGARAHLLLVEDNPVNQKVAARTLERLGYRVDVAQNGLEALEALARKRYAAVLMDVQMPEMDGYEATVEIRRRERAAAHAASGDGRRVPIVAMTANAMQGDREKALASGMDDYLSKPVRQEELTEVLSRWVAQEPEGDDAPVPATGHGAEGGPGENGDDPPLDQEVLEGLRDLGDDELLEDLVGMFLDDATSRLAALREAVEGGDAPTVARDAHTLKGSSGNMGATKMAAICAELEQAGASGDLARAPELLGRLEEEFGRVRPAIEAEVGKDGGS